MVDQSQYLSLLEHLYQNSRITNSELEKILHISRQTIEKMRDKLWDNGTIFSPALLLNPNALQYFFMEIETTPSEPQLLQKIESILEVASVDGILGTYSLIVKFEVQTKKQFSEILSRIDEQIAQTLFQSYRIIEVIDIFKLGGFIIPPHSSFKQIDEKRWTLLQILKKNYNPKKWVPREGKDVIFSQPLINTEKINLSREIDRFIDDDIIQRFTINLGKPMPDFSTKFYMRIKPKQIGQYTKLAEKLVHHPNIIDLYRTGEDSGLLAVVRTKGLDGFKDFIKNLYRNFDILDTNTTVVVDEILPTVFPPTLKVAENVCK